MNGSICKRSQMLEGSADEAVLRGVRLFRKYMEGPWEHVQAQAGQEKKILGPTGAAYVP